MHAGGVSSHHLHAPDEQCQQAEECDNDGGDGQALDGINLITPVLLAPLTITPDREMTGSH